MQGNSEGEAILKIPSNDLLRQYNMFKPEYEAKALEVLGSGWYILGREVAEFEREFADFIGKKHCIGVGSGLDALTVALRTLKIGEGDEVIVPANTYIATVMAVTICGATPVFVEPDEFYNIDTTKIKVTPRTKAILSVNLYGQSCDMRALREICDTHSLYLVEDCAQSHGSTFAGKTTPSYADISCYSFYPSKNLGAFADAGALVTDDADIDKNARILRNYGSEKRYHNEVVGMNTRLSEL